MKDGARTVNPLFPTMGVQGRFVVKVPDHQKFTDRAKRLDEVQIKLK
jgi:hypothetical protein